MSTQEATVSTPFTGAARARRRGRIRGALPFLGPAFVAAIAYVDPGNFATNIAGGSKYGYLLLWVILSANLMAMLIQFLSAKVGIATGRIMLAGFSQGAAMALFSGTRYPEKLAGLMGLSGYMVLAPKFDAERTNANQTVPIFLAHGTEDPVVPLQMGEDTHQLLEATQYSVEWHTYPMPHSVSQEEIDDIAEWLRRVL